MTLPAILIQFTPATPTLVTNYSWLGITQVCSTVEAISSCPVYFLQFTGGLHRCQNGLEFKWFANKEINLNLFL
jgi:hypothetical protein